VNHLDRIAGEWRARADDLAAWVMAHLVNRTDVWGRYVRNKSEATTRAVTAPFAAERGKVSLDHDSLRKHFRQSEPGGQLGIHSASRDRTSRWMAIDIDRHDPEDQHAVTREGNLAAAQGWRQVLADHGLDPLLMDSNGIGGFHILVIFAEPMDSLTVNQFADRLVADYERRGLDEKPEVFPKHPGADSYGDWLRLPGRHHTRSHFTRVWNDEPYADESWLTGEAAIDRLLVTRPATSVQLEPLGIKRPRRTVCLDFDGVLHLYRSAWRGEAIIPDPPIHGTAQAVARLREQYRVVVHSTRCRTPEGRAAVAAWLREHAIEVDEVCEHKPPALVYVDDRAIRFRGDWDQLMTEIREFRK
jgi:hypothetical protein